VNASGAHEHITLKTLHANDWAQQGFAAAAIWVGTNSKDAADTWVETGVTHGWAGQNQYVFYTAHYIKATDTYAEHKFSHLPVVGTTAWLEAYRTAPNIFRGEITHSGTTESWSWSNHDLYTVNYDGGLEVTCPTNQVNRTYVDANQYLRSSDGAWVNVTQGLMKTEEAPADVAWCVQPRLFRYFINTTIGSGCF
jgi:hypothetical protein